MRNQVSSLQTFICHTALASVIGVAALSTRDANAVVVYGVSDQLGQLVSFDSSTPGTLLSAIALTGTASGEQIRGIDYVSGVLYGLGSASHLYTINPNTGACSLVGAGAFSPLLNGIDFGFNAGPSQFYISSDLGQNLSLSVGGVATANPNYTPGVGLDSLAYDPLNSLFYGISADSHNMYVVNPLTGATTLLGPTGVNFIDRIGLDISTAGAGFFSATVAGQTEFFNVNLSTGALSLIGDVGTPGELTSGLDSIAITPTVVPEPGTLALAVTGGSLLLFLVRRKR